MIEHIESEIFARKHKLACLHVRLFHMNEKLSSKSNYEKNEIKIKRIDTLFEISKEKKIIEARTELFNEKFRELAYENWRLEKSIGRNG